MIDDGCDPNRWLQAGQMTSSGRGITRRRPQDRAAVRLPSVDGRSDIRHNTRST